MPLWGMLHSELVFWVCIETKAFLSPFTVTMASLLGQGDLKECSGIRGGMKRYCARVGGRGGGRDVWRGAEGGEGELQTDQQCASDLV